MKNNCDLYYIFLNDFPENLLFLLEKNANAGYKDKMLAFHSTYFRNVVAKYKFSWDDS